MDKSNLEYLEDKLKEKINIRRLLRRYNRISNGTTYGVNNETCDLIRTSYVIKQSFSQTFSILIGLIILI